MSFLAPDHPDYDAVYGDAIDRYSADPEPTIIDAATLKPGDRIDGDPYGEGVPVTILRAVEHALETVGPLAGTPLLRFWARRDDTAAEGYMSYGERGVCHLLERA